MYCIEYTPFAPRKLLFIIMTLEGLTSVVARELRVRAGHGRLKNILDNIYVLMYYTVIFGCVPKTTDITNLYHSKIKKVFSTRTVFSSRFAHVHRLVFIVGFIYK